MVNAEQIADAEAKQSGLLARMQEIDQVLGTMTQADPGRAKLKSEKAEIMPRYRGAKTHVKNLRRVYNSVAESPRQVEQDLDEVIVNVNSEKMLAGLHETLVDILDRVHSGEPMEMKGSVVISDNEIDRITDFIDLWEHSH